MVSRRLIGSASLYGLAAAAVAGLLFLPLGNLPRFALFLFAAAAGTAATVALPAALRRRAAAPIGIFIAVSGLLATFMGITDGGPSSDEREGVAEPSPASSRYTRTIRHGDSFPVYRWLAARKNQQVTLNALIDLSPIEPMGGASDFEDVERSSASKGRDIDMVATEGSYELVRLHILPIGRDKADYMSPEFNEYVRVAGSFRVLDVDPAVGSTQIYSVVLQYE
jgi:hypothetical protein